MTLFWSHFYDFDDFHFAHFMIFIIFVNWWKWQICVSCHFCDHLLLCNKALRQISAGNVVLSGRIYTGEEILYCVVVLPSSGFYVKDFVVEFLFKMSGRLHRGDCYIILSFSPLWTGTILKVHSLHIVYMSGRLHRVVIYILSFSPL